MSEIRRYSDYDRLAWFYDKYWGGAYRDKVVAVLETVFFPLLPPQGRILDVGCGTGHLTGALAERGYEMTGIDGSEEMLRFARRHAPAAKFILSDARTFSLPPRFDAAISTFDSLNHIIRIEELTMALENIWAALKDGAPLLFDLNIEEAYLTLWETTSAMVERNDVCIVKGSYDKDEKVGRTDVTMFRLESGVWQRSDVTLLQKCYAPDEILSALKHAGFIRARTFDARRDLGMSGEIGLGRIFFLAFKPANGKNSEG